MSIRIISPNLNKSLSVTRARRIREQVEKELTVPGGGTVMSASGQTLAIAVDYAEAHNICYKITAIPSAGYFFEIIRNADGTPQQSPALPQRPPVDRGT